MLPKQPIDHEKIVLGQMLGEAYQQALAMRIQISTMQAQMTEMDAEIVSLKAQIAPPPEAPAESQ